MKAVKNRGAFGRFEACSGYKSFIFPAFFVMFRSYAGHVAANKTSLTARDLLLSSTCGEDNPMEDPVSSLMSMFIMSLNKFDETVCHFDRTDHPALSVVRYLHPGISRWSRDKLKLMAAIIGTNKVANEPCKIMFSLSSPISAI